MNNIDPLPFTRCAQVGDTAFSHRDDNQDIIALWILRILVHLGGYREFTARYSSHYEAILRAIGLGDLKTEGTAPAEVLNALRERLAELEVQSPKVTGNLARNLEILGDALDLCAVEKEILGFAVLAHSSERLEDATATLGECRSRAAVVAAVATCTDHRAAEIHAALRAEAPLSMSGLLRVSGADDRGSWLGQRLELLDGLADAMLLPHDGIDSLLADYLDVAPPPDLGWEDFAYVGTDAQLILEYLRGTRKNSSTGANLLIYGQSGTGKTQLARVVAAKANLTLYEVASEMSGGRVLEAEQRYTLYRLGQALLARKPDCALLFDEVEDLFPWQMQAFFAAIGRGAASKAAINQLLESNPVPTLWLSNHAQHIDEAHLRRFDYVFEMRAPTRATRRRILDRYLEAFPVGETWLDQMAEHEHLTPAVIERAAQVVAQLSPNATGNPEKTLQRIMGNALQVMGLPRKPRHAAPAATRYRLDVLNADTDLAELTAGLEACQQGRLSLYGPSGTGKTGFGQYLARKLDRPLLYKRASDVLSCWVGEAEKNIARMFRDAEQDGAVLLLDEADSFLQDRGGAQRSWEITQVNEMLTQMETFEGIFIASTNLMDTLDAASARRFDLKIRFDYLEMAQVWALFTQVLHEHGQPESEGYTHYKHQLERLDRLTPGDFVTVIRRSKIMGEPMTADTLLDGLAREHATKPGGERKAIGFTARL